MHRFDNYKDLTKWFNLIISFQSCWLVSEDENTNQIIISHWSFTKCYFQHLKTNENAGRRPGQDWRRATMFQCRSIFNSNDLVTEQYECLFIFNNTFYIIRNNTLTGQGYTDEILRYILVPYTATIDDDFILWRQLQASLDTLCVWFSFQERIIRMFLPACSPDMNLIAQGPASNLNNTF